MLCAEGVADVEIDRSPEVLRRGAENTKAAPRRRAETQPQARSAVEAKPQLPPNSTGAKAAQPHYPAAEPEDTWEMVFYITSLMAAVVAVSFLVKRRGGH